MNFVVSPVSRHFLYSRSFVASPVDNFGKGCKVRRFKGFRHFPCFQTLGPPPFGLPPIGLPPSGLTPIGLPPIGLPPIGQTPNWTNPPIGLTPIWTNP